MKILYFLLLVFILSWQNLLAAEKSVLILHSYHAGFAWTDQIQEGLNESLKTDKLLSVDYRVEYMNSFEAQGRDYQEDLARLYKKKYRETPDLIIAVDNIALQFLKDYRKKIWGELPVIFTGMSSYSERQIEGFEKVSGISESIPLFETLSLARTFHPFSDNYIFLYNSGKRGEDFKNEIQKIESKFPSIHFQYIADPTFPSIFEKLKAVDKNSVLFLMNFFSDGERRLYSIPYGTRYFYEKVDFPLYSFWEQYLGQGIVGGKLLQGTKQGQLAGELALKVLAGASIENIPVNRHATSLYRFDAQELEKQKISIKNLPQGTEFVNRETSFFAKNETVFLAFISMVVFFLLAFVLLLVYYLDRRKILHKLHEKNERLSSLTSNIPDIVLYRTKVDNPQTVLFMSETVQRLTGFKKNEIHELMKIVHPDDQAYVKSERERQIHKGKTFEIDYRILCQNQSFKYVKEKAQMVETSDGQVIDGVLIDISQIKNLEKEKNQIQNQLFQSARLASVGTLAAGVAHEINNPLAILQGYFDIVRKTLDKKGWLDNNLRDYFENGRQSLERIGFIVNGLRTFAKSDQDNYGPVNLHKVIEDTAGLCQPIFKKMNINIHYRLEAPFFLVHGNEGKLQQVIMNILTNSRDAIAESERKLEGSITILTSLGSGSLYLKIEDNGCGIPREYWQRVFDPFFTTKPPGKGIGLGLSIAHSIIELMHGNIDVYSNEGQGTIVTISLPLSLTIAQGEALNKMLAPQKSKTKISGAALVIDDETGMRRVLKSYLEMYGLEVIEAEDGKEALNILKEKSFSYVFVDHHMPRMDGAQLLEELHRSQTVGTADYFFMTGGFVDDVLTPELKTFVKGFLNKPFTEEDLAKLLKIN